MQLKVDPLLAVMSRRAITTASDHSRLRPLLLRLGYLLQFLPELVFAPDNAGSGHPSPTITILTHPEHLLETIRRLSSIGG